MRLFCRTEKWKPLISDRERKVQWIVVLRRTDSERKYDERNFTGTINRFFSGPGHFIRLQLSSPKGLYAY